MSRRTALSIALLLAVSNSLTVAMQPPQAGPYLAYLPLTQNAVTLPPSYQACAADPYAERAPNYPVAILMLDKEAELVILIGRSPTPVNIDGWKLCSMAGQQLHANIFPGITLPFDGSVGIASRADGPIWDDTIRDDAALYDANGSLVSYFVDQ